MIHVWYSIGVDSPITPAEPLPALPTVPVGSMVIIEGRAPIWRYAMAVLHAQDTPCFVIATYDPRLGVVVVDSYSQKYVVGQVVTLEPPTPVEEHG